MNSAEPDAQLVQQAIAGDRGALLKLLAARGESRRFVLRSVHHQDTLISEVREDCDGDGATETGASRDVLGSDR